MAMTYEDALRYLYSLTNYEIKNSFSYQADAFELGRVERFLQALGNPHRQFKSVHVAGTKGKGSTAAMLASVLQAAGYRTALFTSPHLHCFRERSTVNGVCITEDEMAALTARVKPIADRDPQLTTFEVATAIAFLYFAEQKADVAVIEVGLGGRLDATNVIHPLVSIITLIGHDHMHILGKTLSKIACEKAGIIKQGVPVVSGPQELPALEVIERVAAEKGAPVWPVGRTWHWRSLERDLDGQTFSVSGRVPETGRLITYRSLRIPLLGPHQLRNATIALATVERLRESGLEIDETAIRAGLSGVNWPGRFEIMGRQPYVVIDGAHNVDSARAVAHTLEEYFPGEHPWFVLAILKDKDAHAILQALLPRAQGVVFARSQNPRAADAHDLAREAELFDIPTFVETGVGAALARAMSKVGPAGLVVATGSFSTASEARIAYLQQHNLPLPDRDPI